MCSARLHYLRFWSVRGAVVVLDCEIIYTGSAKKMYTQFNEKKSILYVSTKFNYTSQIEYNLQ
jgi:hypothetical protein